MDVQKALLIRNSQSAKYQMVYSYFSLLIYAQFHPAPSNVPPAIDGAIHFRSNRKQKDGHTHTRQKAGHTSQEPFSAQGHTSNNSCSSRSSTSLRQKGVFFENSYHRAATPRCVYCVLSTPLVRRFQKKIAQLHAQQQSSNKKDDAPLVFTHNGGGAKQQHLVFSIDSAQLGDVQQQPPWQPTHESERTFKPWLRWRSRK